MRKNIVKKQEEPAEGEAEGAWLDLASMAHVEMSSEDPEHPVERAFTLGAAAEQGGWLAGETGQQTLKLQFDAPQKLKRVMLRFCEAEHERMQEFSLTARFANGEIQEMVRQQWSFSLGGSTEEQENYLVNLDDVVEITLWVDPDRGRDRYRASLETFRVEG